MSEIDVKECRYNWDDTEKKRKNQCSIIYGNCKDFKDCYYRQLQQQKQENEELKSKLDIQESIGYPLCFTCIVEDCECNKSKLYEECVNEIEKICEVKISDYPMNKIVEITQLIRKVRETINERN